MRFRAVSLVLAFILGALSLAVPGCGGTRASVPGAAPRVQADVSKRVDQRAQAEVKVETAATPGERAEAKAEVKADDHAIATQETLENRSALLWQAMRSIAVVAFALALVYEFGEFKLVKLAGGGVALGAGGYALAALTVRALLPHLDAVLTVGAAVLVLVLWRQSKLGHAALSEMAADTANVRHAMSGKVATAVKWLEDRLHWHTAKPTPSATPTIAAAVAATGTITKP